MTPNQTQTLPIVDETQQRVAAGWTPQDFALFNAFTRGEKPKATGVLGNLRLGGDIVQISTPRGKRPSFELFTSIGLFEPESLLP